MISNRQKHLQIILNHITSTCRGAHGHTYMKCNETRAFLTSWFPRRCWRGQTRQQAEGLACNQIPSESDRGDGVVGHSRRSQSGPLDRPTGLRDMMFLPEAIAAAHGDRFRFSSFQLLRFSNAHHPKYTHSHIPTC